MEKLKEAVGFQFVERKKTLPLRELKLLSLKQLLGHQERLLGIEKDF
jgi:hypothetical protein